MDRTILSLSDWKDQGLALFGKDANLWRWKCPSCGHAQSLADFLSLGMPTKKAQAYIGFSCIGRWKRVLPGADVVDALEGLDKGWGCDYSGGCAFNISPLAVVIPGGSQRFTFGWDQ